MNQIVAAACPTIPICRASSSAISPRRCRSALPTRSSITAAARDHRHHAGQQHDQSRRARASWRLKERDRRRRPAEIAAAFAVARDSFDFSASTGSSIRSTTRFGGAADEALSRAADAATAGDDMVLAQCPPRRRAGRARGPICGRDRRAFPDTRPGPAAERLAADGGSPPGAARSGHSRRRGGALRRLADLQRAPDIVQVAARAKEPIKTVAQLFFEVGSALAIDRLVGQAMQIPPSRFHERLAINRTVDGILQIHRAIAARAMKGDGAAQGWSAWSAGRAELVCSGRAGRSISFCASGPSTWRACRLPPTSSPKSRQGTRQATGGARFFMTAIWVEVFTHARTA